MKIKDVEEMHKGEYTEMEVYRNSASNRPGFHTDRIRSVDDYTEDTEVIEYELADEEKYNQTILANTGQTADFNEWYGNKDAKILLVKVDI